MSSIRPVGDRILIKQHKPEETYGSTGIYIPESSQEKQDKGTVVAVGDDVKGIFDLKTQYTAIKAGNWI